MTAIRSPLWTPSEAGARDANLTRYVAWLKEELGLVFNDYATLWQWSVDQPALFWESLWQYFKIKSYSPYTEVMSRDPMPHTRWFSGSTLNYAEHVFRNRTDERPALLFCAEQEPLIALSWAQLEQQTAALQAFLRNAGIQPGDRIAAWLPNIPEATIALMASLSLGAVWSSCSPDFGIGSVTDRFRQIGPRVLIAVDGYRYQGKVYDRLDVVRDIRAALPTVEKVILIPGSGAAEPDTDRIPGAVSWATACSTPHTGLSFTPLPFDHPIWVLYSSGTTGIPKAITHSHGGMLLEHLKYLHLHNDVRPGENFFWYSTTGWMMWNFTQASLLCGATAVLYDGSPAYPGLGRLWELAAEAPIHHFGTSAAFLMACRKEGMRPGGQYDLSALRSIGSTGSPLPPEGFEYVYNDIKPDVWLCSMSGGTDVCTAWVGGCPWRPVYAGEIQCRCLGVAMYAFDEEGSPIEGVGEMVVTKPLPCMPVYFWNDTEYARYRESYFETYPGIWRHGDWLRITPHDGLEILGRSDATLNRQGVRIGTAEVYRAVDKVPEIKDSLVLNLERPGGSDYMPLFVLMREGQTLTPEIAVRLKQVLRSQYSPRHVPDEIIAVPDIPYTLSGKKMEAPVKKLLQGVPLDKAVNQGAMRNPAALDFFVQWAAEHPD
ncbi:acetoacetate--CoA ligase [Compostibacter hankyongensis]|uniref:Acetoacetate--CoA ligase n=1 Tax=Compostibacter hankyongensis TaxID=1007089 RepID=A0ABP8G3A9_9BACT